MLAEWCGTQGYTERGIACWTGNDDEAHDAVHRHGATGVISVTSNIVPGLFASMMSGRRDDTNASLQASPLSPPPPPSLPFCLSFAPQKTSRCLLVTPGMLQRQPVMSIKPTC